jgi:hypothetical protein
MIKRVITMIGVAAMMVGCSTEETTQEPAVAPLYDFSAIEGRWVKYGTVATVSEFWEKSGANSWKGGVYRVEESDSSLIEALRLYVATDSSVVYEAMVFGQNDNQAIPFQMSFYAADSMFVFQNPNHDFPQQIKYHLRNDTLEIVWGLISTQEKDRVFVFSRFD